MSTSQTPVTSVKSQRRKPVLWQVERNTQVFLRKQKFSSGESEEKPAKLADPVRNPRGLHSRGRGPRSNPQL